MRDYYNKCLCFERSLGVRLYYEILHKALYIYGSPNYGRS